MNDIVVFPDERLHAKCVDCDIHDKTLVKMSTKMAKLMYDNSGVGIAAPQIGSNKRIIVVDCDYDADNKKTRDPLVLVNPIILETSGEKIEENEGCLSCPGISVPITRFSQVKVRYFDLNADEWEISADELLARCLQHEIDHLNGITLFEACEPQTRLDALEAYEIAKRNGAKPGDIGEE